MVLFPGCACCIGPCYACQTLCGYVLEANYPETEDDLTGWFNTFWANQYNEVQVTFGKSTVGPNSCDEYAEGFGFGDLCWYFADQAPATADDFSADGAANYFLVRSGPHLSGEVSSFSTSDYGWSPSLVEFPIATSDNRGCCWILNKYVLRSATPDAPPNPNYGQTKGDFFSYRADSFVLSWSIFCDTIPTEDEQGLKQVVMLTVQLDQYVYLNGNPIGNIYEPDLVGQDQRYDPPYTFDDDYEDEWPYIAKKRTRRLERVLAEGCRLPDSITAACRESNDPVVDWRPEFLTLRASDDGVTLTENDSEEVISWDTDVLSNDSVEEWREYEFDEDTSTYVTVFKRAPDGEQYFDWLPMEPITWEANLLRETDSISGDVTVTVDGFCDGGLNLTATEDVIELDEGTLLPLGEEQAAYVHAYNDFSPAMDPCPLPSYPSWSVYWKKQHLIITDLSVARCGNIPSVTTFTVWFYIDGLINDEEVNEINGVPVSGFVMAVRSWNVTIRAGQDPVVTLNAGSSSPCSAVGAMPYCNDAVPEPVIAYSGPP